MDCEDEDDLGGEMREVAQVAEDVHHGCGGDAVGRGGVQASVRSRGAELELS